MMAWFVGCVVGEATCDNYYYTTSVFVHMILSVLKNYHRTMLALTMMLGHIDELVCDPGSLEGTFHHS